jgi:hypothetical protein
MHQGVFYPKFMKSIIVYKLKLFKMKTLKIFALLCFILAFTTKVNAQTTSTKEIFVDFMFYIDCIGESAIGTLVMNAVMHFDKNGNLTSWHYNPQAGILIGETTGTVYHTVGVTQEKWKPSYTNGAGTYQFISNFLCIGMGKEAVKWGGKYTGHITMTKAGDVTVSFDRFEPVCQ